jgi:RNA polymerase sigma-70 factor (ECF subfamily)
MAAGLEELFRAHWPLVHGYLTRRTGDPELAEELAQETFYRATRAFLGWRGGSPVAWLLSISRNVLIDEARRGRRLVPLPESIVDPSQPVSENEVRDVLARLPDSQRRVLELIYVHGYSHAEIGAMTGTSEGAVKTAAWRARAAFRSEYLSGTEPESDSHAGATA